MKVSVIVPNFNHAEYLEKRLMSIENQTEQNFECILLDDASTDRSREIIQDISAKDNRYSAYCNQINSGSTFVQWNLGVKCSKAELIWIAESDDVASPELLEKLIRQFDLYPDIVLAYCQSNRMNSSGDVTGDWKTFTDELDLLQFDSDFIMDGKEFIRRFLIHRNVIPNASAVVFRKSIYEKVGGANKSFKTNGDWLLWLKMLCCGQIAFVSQPLNYFRYHDNSVIAKHSKNCDLYVYIEKYDYCLRSLFKDYVKEKKVKLHSDVFRFNRQYMRFDFGNKGLFYLTQGVYIKGWKYIFKATFQWPFQFGYFKRAIYCR